ncbi:MAG: helix-turn-helix domain-containing protein [Roseovarius sp.]
MQYGKLNQPDLGQQIKKMRREKNLSQAALAELANISQGSVSRVEDGKLNTGKSVDSLRNLLSYRTQESDEVTAILSAIGTSDELRALILRILDEKSSCA